MVEIGTSELIRRGNAIIAAAQRGELGITEEQLRQCQREYVNTNSKTTAQLFAPAISMFCIGLVFLLEGIMEVPIMGYVGVGLLSGAFYLGTAASRARENGRRYTKLVESEYPKLKQTA
jgi:hypothetical protein